MEMIQNPDIIYHKTPEYRKLGHFVLEITSYKPRKQKNNNMENKANEKPTNHTYLGFFLFFVT